MTGAETGLSRGLKLVGVLALVLGVLVPTLVVLQDSAFISPENRSGWSWRRALIAEVMFWSLWLLSLPLLTDSDRQPRARP